jgi:hypothetical protein
MKRVALEAIKFLYSLLVGGIVFLFFCLLLDLFGWVAGGGWNPLLGSWPIFSGTVASVVFGDFVTVSALLLSMGGIARIILWDREPLVLDFLTQPRT